MDSPGRLGAREERVHQGDQRHKRADQQPSLYLVSFAFVSCTDTRTQGQSGVVCGCGPRRGGPCLKVFTLLD